MEAARAEAKKMLREVGATKQAMKVLAQLEVRSDWGATLQCAEGLLDACPLSRVLHVAKAKLLWGGSRRLFQASAVSLLHSDCDLRLLRSPGCEHTQDNAITLH